MAHIKRLDEMVGQDDVQQKWKIWYWKINQPFKHGTDTTRDVEHFYVCPAPENLKITGMDGYASRPKEFNKVYDSEKEAYDAASELLKKEMDRCLKYDIPFDGGFTNYLNSEYEER